jgi:3-methyl-2-oxobutanoate hydroxymethyltransferase
MQPPRVTIPDIRARKGGTPLVMLTAYTAPVARAVDEACDIVLVGDSVGMVLYGMDNPLAVSLEMMIAHGCAVVKATHHACVVVDMPFGSYQTSKEQAFDNAAKVMAQTGCAAVKLEGGVEMAETITFLEARGIPVMGHVGLQPQSMHRYGGFKAQGRDSLIRERIVADAKAVADAGAFAMVLEAVYLDVAEAVVKAVPVPVIGIGAGNGCDGQVLVTEDMAGLGSGHVPRFVKKYADGQGLLRQAAQAYAGEVRTRAFPAPEHCYAVAVK